jgi:hypothetical protein
MARVTWTEVNLIMEEDQPEDVVNASIIGANAFITAAVGTDTVLTDVMKKELERYMCAHLLTSTVGRQFIEAGGGPAPKIRYVNQYGQNLRSTSYGQAVLTMDVTGKIAAFSDRTRSRVRAVPMFPS